jgi:hypothetical protein
MFTRLQKNKPMNIRHSYLQVKMIQKQANHVLLCVQDIKKIKASSPNHHIYEITINISNINTFKGDLDLTTSIKDEYPPLLNIKPTSSLLDLVQGLVIKIS